jgi:hypothetical protein
MSSANATVLNPPDALPDKSVSGAAAGLQAAEAIHYRRGVITILEPASQVTAGRYYKICASTLAKTLQERLLSLQPGADDEQSAEAGTLMSKPSPVITCWVSLSVAGTAGTETPC